MKLTRQSIIAAGTLVIGGFIGASALVAAASSTWVSAPNSPSDCPSTVLGCNAPLNVGLIPQTRSGLLGLANLLVTNLTVATSTSNPTVQSGYVLTAANNTGTVKWAALPTSDSSVTSGSTASGYWYRVGPLLIQGGIAYGGSGSGNTYFSIVFPKPYSTVASVQLTPLDSSGYTQVHPEQQVLVKDISTTGFDYKTINNNGASWLAVGTALDVVPLSTAGVTCTIATSTSYTTYTFRGTISGTSPSTLLYYYTSNTSSFLSNRSVTVPGSWQQYKISSDNYTTQPGQYLKISSPYSSTVTVPCTL